MTKNDIWLDIANVKQVKWWNTIGGKLVKIDKMQSIIRFDNQEVVGYLVWLHKGLFNKVVSKVTNSFFGSNIPY